MKKSKLFLFLSLPAILGTFAWWMMARAPKNGNEPLTHVAQLENFTVDVNAVGELEAANSTIIASTIPTDNSKIIYIIADGASVNPGDPLVKIDPTPYEVKVAELKLKITDQENALQALEKNYIWETSQSEIELKVAALEVESAELELSKIVTGDGPMDISRLKSAMLKAQGIVEEMQGYYNELLELEKEGFVNFAELKQAEKKLQDGKETLEVATLQHDSFVNHVYPMQIKKGESQVKRAKIRLDEVSKSTEFRISKAATAVNQAKAQLKELANQLRWAEYDLSMTEIKATTPGMVVLRDEFRQGQRRKPRIGDLAVKNQPLLDLPDLNSLIVKSKIREMDLHKIALGKLATIEVDAYPEMAFPGKIIHIGVLALPDTNRFGEEKYFEVHVALENTDMRLRPGMTARVIVHAADLKETISVPFQAVFDIRKQSYCYVKNGNGYEMRPVVPGACNEKWIQIKSGLEVGEIVALSTP
jgi:HlyD family secretion protein